MESYWNRVGQPNGRAFEQTQGDSEERGSLVCCSLGLSTWTQLSNGTTANTIRWPCKKGTFTSVTWVE